MPIEDTCMDLETVTQDEISKRENKYHILTHICETYTDFESWKNIYNFKCRVIRKKKTTRKNKQTRNTENHKKESNVLFHCHHTVF